MDSGNQNMKLGEAVDCFLSGLPASKRETNRQVIYHFGRWFGWERPLAGLTAPEIANYAERVSSSDADYVKKLDLVRAFLTHAKKAGWTKGSLAIHFKPKKRKVKATPWSSRASPETISLTQPGYNEMKKELAALRSQRPQIISEIHRAAEDKDFRENAPLAAAKEELGHLEGRIKKLEETLKSAVLISNQPKLTPKVGIGASIVLLDLASGEELHYTIVNPREVAPLRGKISSASPIGKAIIGRVQGDTIEIAAPAGRLRYRIKQIGNQQT